MAKVPVPVEEIMNNPNLSLTSSPFSPGNMIIKRASFKSGEVPEPLQGNQIRSGECADLTGKVVYDGKRIPKTAACVAGVPRSQLEGSDNGNTPALPGGTTTTGNAGANRGRR